MFSLEIESDADGRDMLIADLWEQGSCGIAEPDGHCLRAFFEDDADRDALLARYPGASIRIEEDRDWVRSARDLLQPMEVGARFFLVPQWRDDPAPPGRFRSQGPAMPSPHHRWPGRHPPGRHAPRPGPDAILRTRIVLPGSLARATTRAVARGERGGGGRW